MLLGLQSNADAHGAVGQRAFSQYTQCPIPVVGTVRAGYDALAFEEDYGTEYASVKDPQNYFYLVVKGDSMEPRISDGDLALITARIRWITVTLALWCMVMATVP